MTTPGNSLRTRASGRKLVFVCVFDAPRELVFKMWTDPKHLPEWWGPKYLKTTVEKLDLRPGGAWRILQRAPDGKLHAFHGVYREVQPPERLVQTFVYEPWPDQEILVTVTFEDLGGKTKLTSTSLYPTIKSLRGYLDSGAKDGMAESIERFTKLLRRIRKTFPASLVVKKPLTSNK